MSQDELARLQRAGESRLIQFLREALDRTQGKPTQDDTTAATEIYKQHRIDKERAQQIVGEVRALWKKAHLPRLKSSQAENVKTTLEMMTETLGVITNMLGMKFAWIRPGTFVMGSHKNEDERRDDEVQHKVTLTKGFYMGVHTVTQEQWKEIMGRNPSRFKGTRNLPVESVSWVDCQEFIKKLRERDPKNYRLPTESEWEYACRAGTTTAFHFGERLTTDQANYDGVSTSGYGKKGEYRQKTTPVGSFAANVWGLHDMHGNVTEWCQDFYGPYPPNDVIDPQGPVEGQYRVLRSGSWLNIPQISRSAFRYRDNPVSPHFLYGFRLCFCLD